MRKSIRTNVAPICILEQLRTRHRHAYMLVYKSADVIPTAADDDEEDNENDDDESLNFFLFKEVCGVIYWI